MTDPREQRHSRVPLNMLQRYLEATGWHALTSTRSSITESTSPASRLLENRPSPSKRNFNIYMSSSEGNEGIELVLPDTQFSPEYDYLINRVIDALSSLEERSTSLIVQSIREIAFDVLRSKIPDTQVVDETIHLERARGFVVGIRSVLAAAATTELQPSPYFLRLKKEAAVYADSCRFGHTFHGSFGFTVESPLQRNNQITLPGLQPIPPFERRVIRRLCNGLAAVSQATSTDSIEPIVDNVSTGFSANVCEQFASLVEETSPSGLTLDFSFSPEWVEVGRESTQKFSISQPQIEVIKAAAKELRAKTQSWPETVFGRVTRLASEADPSDLTDMLGEREVAVLWSSEQLGDISVRVALSPSDYLSAVEAHAAGRPIEISGTLERRARRWVLLNPSGFSS